MSNLIKLPTWADKTLIHAVVETPRGSCKLEFDPKLRAFALANSLMAGLIYPNDWGFIPSTKAEDVDCAADQSACSKFCRSPRVRKRETIVFLQCPTARRLKAIYKTCGGFPAGLSTNWKSFSKPPARWKTRNSNF